MATSYSNNGATGERRPEIVVTSNFTSSNADIGGGNSYTYGQLLAFVDGLTTIALGNAGTAREFGNANDGGDRNITFDWGVGASIVIDEFKVYISGTGSFGGAATWTIEGSNNGSAWTTLKSAFVLTANNNAATTLSFSNSTGYRYYRLRTNGVGSAFGGGTGSWTEFEFKIEDITPEASRPSWFNTNGFGNRGATISISTTLTFSAGSIGNVINGSKVNDASNAVTLNASQSSKEIKFDFGSGAEGQIVIDTVILWTGLAPAQTHGSWKLQGSDDDSSYTDLESSSNLFDNVSNFFTITKRIVANTTGYRYYKLLQTSGSTSANPTITEIEFRVAGTAGGGGGGGVTQPVVIICTGG